MPRIDKNIRTYSAKPRTKLQNHTSILAASNLQEKFQKKFNEIFKKSFNLSEKSVKSIAYLSDGSIEVSLEDTFDKLLKKNACQQKFVVDSSIKSQILNGETSKLNLQNIEITNEIHSPIITRKVVKNKKQNHVEVEKSAVKSQNNKPRGRKLRDRNKINPSNILSSSSFILPKKRKKVGDNSKTKSSNQRIKKGKKPRKNASNEENEFFEENKNIAVTSSIEAVQELQTQNDDKVIVCNDNTSKKLSSEEINLSLSHDHSYAKLEQDEKEKKNNLSSEHIILEHSYAAINDKSANTKNEDESCSNNIDEESKENFNVNTEKSYQRIFKDLDDKQTLICSTPLRSNAAKIINSVVKSVIFENENMSIIPFDISAPDYQSIKKPLIIEDISQEIEINQKQSSTDFDPDKQTENREIESETIDPSNQDENSTNKKTKMKSQECCDNILFSKNKNIDVISNNTDIENDQSQGDLDNSKKSSEILKRRLRKSPLKNKKYQNSYINLESPDKKSKKAKKGKNNTLKKKSKKKEKNLKHDESNSDFLTENDTSNSILKSILVNSRRNKTKKLKSSVEKNDFSLIDSSQSDGSQDGEKHSRSLNKFIKERLLDCSKSKVTKRGRTRKINSNEQSAVKKRSYRLRGSSVLDESLRQKSEDGECNKKKNKKNSSILPKVHSDVLKNNTNDYNGHKLIKSDEKITTDNSILSEANSELATEKSDYNEGEILEEINSHKSMSDKDPLNISDLRENLETKKVHNESLNDSIKSDSISATENRRNKKYSLTKRKSIIEKILNCSRSKITKRGRRKEVNSNQLLVEKRKKLGSGIFAGIMEQLIGGSEDGEHYASTKKPKLTTPKSQTKLSNNNNNNSIKKSRGVNEFDIPIPIDDDDDKNQMTNENLVLSNTSLKESNKSNVKKTDVIIVKEVDKRKSSSSKNSLKLSDLYKNNNKSVDKLDQSGTNNDVILLKQSQNFSKSIKNNSTMNSSTDVIDASVEFSKLPQIVTMRRNRRRLAITPIKPPSFDNEISMKESPQIQNISQKTDRKDVSGIQRLENLLLNGITVEYPNGLQINTVVHDNSTNTVLQSSIEEIDNNKSSQEESHNSYDSVNIKDEDHINISTEDDSIEIKDEEEEEVKKEVINKNDIIDITSDFDHSCASCSRISNSDRRIKLRTSKKFHRSLSKYRRTTIFSELNECLSRHSENFNVDISVLRNSIILNKKSSIVNRLTINRLEDGRSAVLDRCHQDKPEPFSKIYPNSKLKNCKKIGEGVYGEVFLLENENEGQSVMKIIPIEGDQIVNGERQKKFTEIYSEVVIAMELSNLKFNKTNQTSSFNSVRQISCVYGRYPALLLRLWDEYDREKGSENDSPTMFRDDQLYIILELEHGGQDLEAFVFSSPSQTYSIFKQVACALAVAESEFKFEHRDLHWGNILIRSTKKLKLDYKVDGVGGNIPSQGVEVAVIDYTLSRVECNGEIIFNDLSKDNELFEASGDYQFEIYRLMKQANRNKWRPFEPYTNILWLHYIVDKCISGARYAKTTKPSSNKYYLDKLNWYNQNLLRFKSAKELVQRTSFFKHHKY